MGIGKTQCHPCPNRLPEAGHEGLQWLDATYQTSPLPDSEDVRNKGEERSVYFYFYFYFYFLLLLLLLLLLPTSTSSTSTSYFYFYFYFYMGAM
jgi:hypothetical protein